MSANNGEEQMCYFNRNKSDTHFISFSALHTQAEPIRFSIVKANSTLILSIKASTSMLKVQREPKRQLQQASSENFNNGRSENKKRTNSDQLYDNVTESTNIQQQQRGGLLRRKKPRFLSAKE